MSEAPKLAHYELLRLLGEIDSIGVEYAGGSALLYLSVRGKRHLLGEAEYGFNMTFARENIAAVISKP